MAEILIASCPPIGHVGPLLNVARGLVDRGDEVTFLTSERHASKVFAAGAHPHSLPAGADYDDTIREPLPGNTYVAEYIPHDVLLPHVDVMVTNGGYGAVQRALMAGVPLIVAGSTEDKPEVAARVEHFGAGINLRTGTPGPGAIRRAVRDVLDDEGYRRAASRLKRAYGLRDGVTEIAALVDEVIAERAVAVDHA